ncbi:MAG: hypothetical protein ACC662_08195, partial [Planctomycetota bacterium]
IEAVQMLPMAKTGVTPAGFAYQRSVAESIQAAERIGVPTDAQRAEFAHFVEALNEAVAGLDAVRDALHATPEDEGTTAQARHLTDVLVPAMDELRAGCDAVESRCDGRLWPFPTYHELLFQ